MTMAAAIAEEVVRLFYRYSSRSSEGSVGLLFSMKKSIILSRLFYSRKEAYARARTHTYTGIAALYFCVRTIVFSDSLVVNPKIDLYLLYNYTSSCVSGNIDCLMNFRFNAAVSKVTCFNSKTTANEFKYTRFDWKVLRLAMKWKAGRTEGSLRLFAANF